MDWTRIIDEEIIAAVVPGDYAPYRKAIRASLIFFLEGLPHAFQDDVLKAQAALSLNASAAERIAVLARSCPALHKLGQMLARDRRLAPDVRKHLQVLESLPASTPSESIRELLTKDLGPLENLNVKILSPSIGEASVAIAIPFRKGSEEGVFKVLKPGIEQRLMIELERLERVGSFLDQKYDEFRIPPVDYMELFGQVREKLGYEVRLDLEQAHLASAREVYSDTAGVQIPKLFEFCSPRVTAMERVRGRKITDHGITNENEKRRLAEFVITQLIGRAVFSGSGSRFHGDPHAGNLFLTDDNRLAILDWSLVGELGDEERSAFTALILAAVGFRTERVIGILKGISKARAADPFALESVVRASMGKIRTGTFPAFRWLTRLLDECVKSGGLRFHADMMLFRRVLHILEGVLLDIGAEEDLIDIVLVREFLGHFFSEWPRRFVSDPMSQSFATRLSNADLTEFLISLPWVPARLFLRQMQELLNTEIDRLRA